MVMTLDGLSEQKFSTRKKYWIVNTYIEKKSLSYSTELKYILRYTKVFFYVSMIIIIHFSIKNKNHEKKKTSKVTRLV